MDTQILLIIGAVVVVGALVVIWQQRQGVVKRPSGAEAMTKETMEPMKKKGSYQKKGAWPFEPENDETMAQIQQALRAGKKIEAIKLYREMTGTGLKEAKDAIDALEAGQKPASPQASGAIIGQVEQELRAGRKINAVKLYREAHNVGLKEAKDAVDEMQRNLGIR